jgi:hypothetical protein
MAFGGATREQCLANPVRTRSDVAPCLEVMGPEPERGSARAGSFWFNLHNFETRCRELEEAERRSQTPAPAPAPTLDEEIRRCNAINPSLPTRLDPCLVRLRARGGIAFCIELMGPEPARGSAPAGSFWAMVHNFEARCRELEEAEWRARQ